MRFGLQSAAEVPADALRVAFNAAFADYLVGPPDLDAEAWPLFLRRQGVNLASSVAATERGAVQAFVLVCPIDAQRTRIAAMGAVPAARGSGAAAGLLDHVLAQARERGASSCELEVFAQNGRALRLYESRSFVAVAELFGYERAPGAAEPPREAPQAVSRAQAIAWLQARAVENLPFQVSAPAVADHPAALVAWRSRGAQLVFVARDETQAAVVSLVDTEAGQRGARNLVQALAAAYPRATLRVPQLQRTDLGGGALAALGWQRLPLHQRLMRRDLRG